MSFELGVVDSLIKALETYAYSETLGSGEVGIDKGFACSLG